MWSRFLVSEISLSRLPLVASAVDYTVRESGLQLDQPPAVGNISSLAVVIQKNDNAEGILEFRQDFVSTTGESQW